jgi:hypothetical protein
LAGMLPVFAEAPGAQISGEDRTAHGLCITQSSDETVTKIDGLRPICHCPAIE